jgi:hypothetical protein
MLTTNDRRDARPCVSTISCVSTVCVVFLHFYMLLLFNFIHFSSLLYIIANQSCGFLRHIFLPFFTNHPQGPSKRCTQSQKKMRQPPKKHKQVLLKTQASFTKNISKFSILLAEVFEGCCCMFSRVFAI